MPVITGILFRRCRWNRKKTTTLNEGRMTPMSDSLSMLCRYLMSGTKKARAETEMIMSQGTQRTASLLVSFLLVQAADAAAERYTTAIGDLVGCFLPQHACKLMVAAQNVCWAATMQPEVLNALHIPCSLSTGLLHHANKVVAACSCLKLTLTV